MPGLPKASGKVLAHRLGRKLSSGPLEVTLASRAELLSDPAKPALNTDGNLW